MAEAYVGLGSNIGDAAGHLSAAVERLARQVAVADLSSTYWTEPVGLREQPHYLNAVVHVRTDLPPRDLLAVLKAIEDDMGRQRDVPLGPRIIDLDLLLYDDVICTEPDLVLPHPRMEERRFVLEPLAEIAPRAKLGRSGPTVAELLAGLPDAESVERMPAPGWPPSL